MKDFSEMKKKKKNLSNISQLLNYFIHVYLNCN